MQGYVDINAASELTGKHKDTIRRLIKQNPKSQYIIKGRQGQYLINKTWVLDQYGVTPENSSHTEAPQGAQQVKDDTTPVSDTTGAGQELYNTLAKQLEAKDQQIAELQKLLHEKEANNTKINDQFQQLMGRFLLPAAAPAEQGEPLDAQPTYAKPAQVKTDAAAAKTRQNTASIPQAKSTPKKPAARKSNLKKTSSPVVEEQPKPKKRWFRR